MKNVCSFHTVPLKLLALKKLGLKNQALHWFGDDAQINLKKNVKNNVIHNVVMDLYN